MAHYIDHYESQIGGGIERVYIGAPIQRGHGIGSFLGGLFRRAVPLLKRGARVLGKEVLRSGMNFISDIDHDVPWKQAFKTRASETGQNLKRKAKEGIEKVMRGEGYKRRYGELPSQYLPGSVPRLTVTTSSTKPVRTRKRIEKKSKKILKSSQKKKKKKKKNTSKKTSKGKKKCCKKRALTDIFGPLRT